uniref:Germin-like protein n=1 Tax=Physcomitrium patens TaxID=3218 RepID=Q4A3V0_PHYPA|nr:germin-like protein precursor [Physcomitrium patens]
MAARFALVMLATMAMVYAAQAGDPELTTDFFVPMGTNKADLNGDYFTSMVFRGEPAVPEGAKIGVKRITSDSFPVLTGLGVSSAQIKYLPGGINPPHTHPRGTELLIVQKGILTVGLVDTTNKFYTKELQAGDVFVFPRGLVHYQINLSHKPVIAYVGFSSSNPGTVSLPATLFGSGIPDNVHMAAFRVNQHVVEKLQAPFKM